MRKYGIDNFLIDEIQAFETHHEVLHHEIYLIRTFKSNRISHPAGNGYNMTDGGDNPPNHKGKKLNNFKKLVGRNLTREHKDAISTGLMGRVVSEETRTKISISNTGKIVGDATGIKLRDIRQDKTYDEIYGKNSQEIKNKISKSLTGKIKSEEHLANISKSLTGKKHSAERIEKSKISHLGHRVTEETRNNLSKAQVGRIKTDEHNNRTSMALIGCNIKNEYISITYLNGDKKIFNNGSEAAKFLGVSPSLVSNRCRNVSSQHPGYIITREIYV